MLDDLEAMFQSDQPLSLFDRFIMEFLHAVHGSQPDLVTLLEQQAIPLFGCQMTCIRFLKNFQDLQARQRGLQAPVSEFGCIRHQTLLRFPLTTIPGTEPPRLSALRSRFHPERHSTLEPLCGWASP